MPALSVHRASGLVAFVTVTSIALGGTSRLEREPPGQRTCTWVGLSGIPKTWTAPSWDQYPEPAWISRAAPSRGPNFNCRIAPTPLGLPLGPSKRTRSPGLAATL